jgi:hypothetical protein
MSDMLMSSTVTLLMLQFLQASPQARRDVSALLSVPRISHQTPQRRIDYRYRLGTRYSQRVTLRVLLSRYVLSECVRRLATFTAISIRADINLIIPKTLQAFGNDI